MTSLDDGIGRLRSAAGQLVAAASAVTGAVSAVTAPISSPMIRLSFSSRAVNIKIGTAEEARSVRAKSKPLSPGIITSRISKSNFSPSSLARASCAVSAVETR